MENHLALLTEPPVTRLRSIDDLLQCHHHTQHQQHPLRDHKHPAAIFGPCEHWLCQLVRLCRQLDHAHPRRSRSSCHPCPSYDYGHDHVNGQVLPESSSDDSAATELICSRCDPTTPT